MALALFALVHAALAQAAWAAPQSGASAPPPAVDVQPVIVANVAPVDTFVGQVQAIQKVNVVARVQAYVAKVSFQDGSMVKPGQLLFELEKGPYQAALMQAEGSLAQAKATLSNAQKTLDRDTKAGKLAISEQQIQQDAAARDEAAGQVAAAEGALKVAELNLSYCTITAPIGGLIGRAQVTEGNLVGPTSGTLASIVQIDPIRVFFNIPDSQLLKAEQQTGTTREQFVERMQLTLTLANGSPYGQVGKIAFLDNQVDPATGTLTAWGQFDNRNKTLIPGAYVTVNMRTSKPEERPLIPVQSVQNDAQGQFVLVVGPDNKVRQQPVTLGRQIAQDFIVTKGLNGGEKVITQGVQKVHPGQTVQATVQPASPPPENPTPNAGTGTAPAGTSGGSNAGISAGTGAEATAAAGAGMNAGAGAGVGPATGSGATPGTGATTGSGAAAATGGGSNTGAATNTATGANAASNSPANGG